MLVRDFKRIRYMDVADTGAAAEAAIESVSGASPWVSIGIGVATGLTMWLIERFILNPLVGGKR